MAKGNASQKNYPRLFGEEASSMIENDNNITWILYYPCGKPPCYIATVCLVCLSP